MVSLFVHGFQKQKVIQYILLSQSVCKYIYFQEEQGKTFHRSEVIDKLTKTNRNTDIINKQIN